MPDILSLQPPTPSPLELLAPRSETGANDDFARRLATAAERPAGNYAEHRRAETPKPSSTGGQSHRETPVVEEPARDEAVVEATSEEAPAPETSDEKNLLAQEAAAAAAASVVVVVTSSVATQPIVEEGARVEEPGTSIETPQPVPSELAATVPPEAILGVGSLETASAEGPRAAVAKGAEKPEAVAAEAELPVRADMADSLSRVAEIENSADDSQQGREQSQQPSVQESSLPTAGRAGALQSTPGVEASREAEVPAKTEESPITEDSDPVREEEFLDTVADLEFLEAKPRVSVEQPVAPDPPRDAVNIAPREAEERRTIDRIPLGGVVGQRNQNSESEGPRINAARFISRVSRAFEAAGESGGTINLRLSPPELGSLALQLSLKEGVLTAQIETDTQAARNALLDNLPALRERLAQQEIRIDKFEVDVRQQGSGSGGSESNWLGGEERPSGGDSRRPQRNATPEVRPERRRTGPAGDGRINLVA